MFQSPLCPISFVEVLVNVLFRQTILRVTQNPCSPTEAFTPEVCHGPLEQPKAAGHFHGNGKLTKMFSEIKATPPRSLHTRLNRVKRSHHNEPSPNIPPTLKPTASILTAIVGGLSSRTFLIPFLHKPVLELGCCHSICVPFALYMYKMFSEG